MKEHEVQRASRRRIREDRRGDPHWTDEGDGYFALHIQYGGNAVVIHVGAGSEDQAAFREWLEYLDAARADPVASREGHQSWCSVSGCPDHGYDEAAPNDVENGRSGGL